MTPKIKINVKLWSVGEVIFWIKGLGDVASQHYDKFEDNCIHGSKLLLLTNSDLSDMGITKLRDQEIILHGVAQLQKLTFEMNNETLKTNTAKLEVAAQNLASTIKHLAASATALHPRDANFIYKIKTNIFIGIENILKCISSILAWLNRLEPEGSHKWDHLQQSLGIYARLFGRYSDEKVTESFLIHVCDDLIHLGTEVIRDFRDPMTVQPAPLEVVQLRKVSGEKIGLEIKCIYSSIAYISAIQPNSPAELSKKFEIADEIIQVGEQTVVSWDIRYLKDFIESFDTKVRFTLRKRPDLSSLSPANKKVNKVKEDPLHRGLSEAKESSPGRRRSVSAEDISKQISEIQRNHSFLRSFDDLHLPNVRSSKIMTQEAGMRIFSGELHSASSDGNIRSSHMIINSPLKKTLKLSASFEDPEPLSSSPRLPQDVCPKPPPPTEPPQPALSDSRVFSFDQNNPKSLSQLLYKKRKKMSSSFESLLDADNITQFSTFPRRPKKNKTNRPTTFQDLGGVDCQGWLRSKFEDFEKWIISWVTLRGRIVCFHNNPEDASPLRSFCLVNYRISPHSLRGSKMFYFRVWESDESYIFALDHRKDMLKWMNKMALASLEDFDTKDLPSILNHDDPKPTEPPPEHHQPEDATSTSDSSEGLEKLYRELRRADVRLDGRDEKQRKSTILTASTSLKGKYNLDVLKLLSLKRILKDKMDKLEAIENFLATEEVTSDKLRDFQVQHPVCILNAPHDIKMAESDV